MKINTSRVCFFTLCRGMNISDLAKAINVSAKVMDRILESGICSHITLCNMARVLGVKPRELIR